MIYLLLCLPHKAGLYWDAGLVLKCGFIAILSQRLLRLLSFLLLGFLWPLSTLLECVLLVSLFRRFLSRSFCRVNNNQFSFNCHRPLIIIYFMKSTLKPEPKYIYKIKDVYSIRINFWTGMINFFLCYFYQSFLRRSFSCQIEKGFRD